MKTENLVRYDTGWTDIATTQMLVQEDFIFLPLYYGKKFKHIIVDITV